jgi:hypothetical protein
VDKAVLAATTEILTRQVSRLNEDQELTEIVQARQPVLDHYQPLFSPDHLPQQRTCPFSVRLSEGRQWRSLPCLNASMSL